MEPSTILTQIKFGTSGWRAVMAEDFTYANVRRGQSYPQPLIWTTSKDDRVGPQHARKFAARLAEYGPEGRDRLWADLGARGYAVAGMICSAEPVMTTAASTEFPATVRFSARIMSEGEIAGVPDMLALSQD